MPPNLLTAVVSHLRRAACLTADLMKRGHLFLPVALKGEMVCRTHINTWPICTVCSGSDWELDVLDSRQTSIPEQMALGLLSKLCVCMCVCWLLADMATK